MVQMLLSFVESKHLLKVQKYIFTYFGKYDLD